MRACACVVGIYIFFVFLRIGGAGTLIGLELFLKMGSSLMRAIVVVMTLAIVASGTTVKADGTEGLGETCASKTAAFAAYAREGQKPSKGKGLSFCDGYRTSTCCGKEQTDAVRVRVVHMQLNGFSETCRDAWAGVECSVCDARVGVAEGMPICERACDALYRACKDDFFAEDSSQRLVPCRPSDTICTKLSEWVGDDVSAKGAEMCKAAGYDPVSLSSSRWCFDGASAASSSSSRSKSRDRSSSSSSKKKSSRTKKQSSGKLTTDFLENFADEKTLLALRAGFAAALVYVILARVLPAALKAWHRRSATNARYAARRAAESRAKSHYL